MSADGVLLSLNSGGSVSPSEGITHEDNNNNNGSEFSPVQMFENLHILPKLNNRKAKGSLRQLKSFRSIGGETGRRSSVIDFSSNDYLGLAQSTRQQQKVEELYKTLPNRHLGSTGSRLLTGDSKYAQDLETRLAKLHKRPSAMLCNSGYDANLAVMSCLSLNSMVIMDELCHNSIQMGLRLGRDYKVRKFRHSSLQDLKRILISEKQGKSKLHSTKPAIIVVESVYSMDGDMAPLKGILEMALSYNACVVVDEAHGLGILGDHGMGLIEEHGLEKHPALLCSIHTFGKAAGCHGAVVCGSLCMKEFLLNYGRPIVYSTSLPLHSLVSIDCSYQSMSGATGRELRRDMRDRTQLFQKLFVEKILHPNNESGFSLPIRLISSSSPINALIIPGNTTCVEFCKRLWKKSNQSILLYPIRSPTVEKGQERVRIIIHSHNTEDEVTYLIDLIQSTLSDMGIITNRKGSVHKSVTILSRL